VPKKLVIVLLCFEKEIVRIHLSSTLYFFKIIMLYKTHSFAVATIIKRKLFKNKIFLLFIKRRKLIITKSNQSISIKKMKKIFFFSVKILNRKKTTKIVIKKFK
jgi:hypothetical protein